jgi:hypothetical protein
MRKIDTFEEILAKIWGFHIALQPPPYMGVGKVHKTPDVGGGKNDHPGCDKQKRKYYLYSKEGMCYNKGVGGRMWDVVVCRSLSGILVIWKKVNICS